jgi:single-strand DNA-binding protein
MNRVTLIGRLGKDPDLRFTPSGQAVCKFSLATTESWKQGNEWKEKTDWHNIVVWGPLAERCGEHLAKGSQVYVEGTIGTRSWETGGKKNYITEVTARVVKQISDLGSTGPTPIDPGADDDIPF